MSSSIYIPQRSRQTEGNYELSSPAQQSSVDSNSPTIRSSLGTTPSLDDSPAGHDRFTAEQKGKAPVREYGETKNDKEQRTTTLQQERRASWMSSSLARSEHTVIDMGETDGNMRLITFLSSSQGFEWNREMFIPSYVSRHRDYSGELERKQDPVEDIILTEEEAQDIFPQ